VDVRSRRGARGIAGWLRLALLIGGCTLVAGCWPKVKLFGDTYYLSPWVPEESESLPLSVHGSGAAGSASAVHSEQHGK